MSGLKGPTSMTPGPVRIDADGGVCCARSEIGGGV